MVRAQSRWMAAVVVVAVSSAPAWAQRVSEPSFVAGITGSGARALGMGGAFIAIADDATAASWNPAGLCVLERAEASVVFQPSANVSWKYPTATFIFDSASQGPTFSNANHEVEVDDAYDFSRDSRSFDFASLTVPVRLGSVKLVPQLSYQRVIDMGFDYDYGSVFSDESTFTSRNAAGAITNTTVQRGTGSFGGTGDVAGGLVVLGLSTGISFTSKVYLGVAVNRWGNGSDAETTFASGYNYDNTGTTGSSTRGSTTSTSVRTNIEDFKGTNFQVGLLAKPASWISVGATYKSAFDMDYDSDFVSTTTAVSRTVVQSGASSPTTTETTTVTDVRTIRTGQIRWPASIGGGIALMPREYLTFSLDVTSVQWSEATLFAENSSNTTRNQTIVRQVGSAAPTTTRPALTPSSSNSVSENPWPVYSASLQPTQPDSLQVRLGGEYVIRNPGLLGLQVLPLRVGISRERQLLRSPQSEEDIYNIGLSAGLGLTWSRLSVDLAYLSTRGARYEGFLTTQESRGTTTTTTSSTNFTPSEDAAFRSGRFFVSSTFRF